MKLPTMGINTPVGTFKVTYRRSEDNLEAVVVCDATTGETKIVLGPLIDGQRRAVSITNQMNVADPMTEIVFHKVKDLAVEAGSYISFEEDRPRISTPPGWIFSFVLVEDDPPPDTRIRLFCRIGLTADALLTVAGGESDHKAHAEGFHKTGGDRVPWAGCYDEVVFPLKTKVVEREGRTLYQVRDDIVLCLTPSKNPAKKPPTLQVASPSDRHFMERLNQN